MWRCALDGFSKHFFRAKEGSMLRFTERGILEICLHGDRYVPLEQVEDFARRELPVPVRISSLQERVEVTMETSDVRLTATFRVDRFRRRVEQSNGCLSPSLNEWILHVLDVFNSPRGR